MLNLSEKLLGPQVLGESARGSVNHLQVKYLVEHCKGNLKLEGSLLLSGRNVPKVSLTSYAGAPIRAMGSRCHIQLDVYTIDIPGVAGLIEDDQNISYIKLVWTFRSVSLGQMDGKDSKSMTLAFKQMSYPIPFIGWSCCSNMSIDLTLIL